MAALMMEYLSRAPSSPKTEGERTGRRVSSGRRQPSSFDNEPIAGDLGAPSAHSLPRTRRGAPARSAARPGPARRLIQQRHAMPLQCCVFPSVFGALLDSRHRLCHRPRLLALLHRALLTSVGHVAQSLLTQVHCCVDHSSSCHVRRRTFKVIFIYHAPQTISEHRKCR